MDKELFAEALKKLPTEKMSVRDILMFGYRAGMVDCCESVSGRGFAEFTRVLLTTIDKRAKQFADVISMSMIGDVNKPIIDAYIAPDDLSDKIRTGEVSIEDAFNSVMDILRGKKER